MRHMKHMVGCVLLIGLLVGAQVVGVVSSTAGLVLVVCPILMIGMFLMMNRDHGDSAEDTLDAYKKALAENDIVVGPLARSAVGAIWA